MDLELASQLKEEGFVHEWCNNDGNGVCCSAPDCLPTLEELIEACGNHFINLSKKGVVWEALGDFKTKMQEKNSRYFSEDGKTPTEAVARLWLSLRN